MQLGLVEETPAKVNKPTAGHFKKAVVPPTRVRREVTLAPGGDPLKNGDQVLALVTRRGRPKGGSVDLVVRNGHLWTLRDGTILSMNSFPDQKDALEAVGLSEQDAHADP